MSDGNHDTLAPASSAEIAEAKRRFDAAYQRIFTMIGERNYSLQNAKYLAQQINQAYKNASYEVQIHLVLAMEALDAVVDEYLQLQQAAHAAAATNTRRITITGTSQAIKRFVAVGESLVELQSQLSDTQQADEIKSIGNQMIGLGSFLAMAAIALLVIGIIVATQGAAVPVIAAAFSGAAAGAIPAAPMLHLGFKHRDQAEANIAQGDNLKLVQRQQFEAAARSEATPSAGALAADAGSSMWNFSEADPSTDDGRAFQLGDRAQEIAELTEKVSGHRNKK